jgi:hypothetical protein
MNIELDPTETQFLLQALAALPITGNAEQLEAVLLVVHSIKNKLLAAQEGEVFA